MTISRRNFMRTAALAAAGGAALGGESRGENKGGGSGTRDRPLFVSTWHFGKNANEAALRIAQQGGGLLDAVEQGVWVVEADATIESVGIGGKPNAEGKVQLDASIMWGPGHQAGSVAALEGILHPISVARRVMEKTPHVMLAGEGARQFALSEGFETVELLTEERRREWLRWKQRQRQGEAREESAGHDTITLLALDADGNIAGGCSTSGRYFKMPGRVGDSPIIGSGLYVDNEVGAAGATGMGENIMRYCASFMAVEHMRRGLEPLAACVETVRWIVRKETRKTDLSVNLVALDKQGRHGAAGISRSFVYAVATPDSSRVVQNVVLHDF